MTDYEFNINDPSSFSRTVDTMMREVFGLEEAEPEPVWENEPDHTEWEISGLSYMYKPHKKKRIRKKYAKKGVFVRQRITLLCEITRMPDMLHLCGYVTVPQHHPLWGKDYFDLDISVHGGLTYGRVWEKGSRYGFDCAHFMDFVPGMYAAFKKAGVSRITTDTYRTMEYVKQEVISLANQLLIDRIEKIRELSHE